MARFTYGIHHEGRTFYPDKPAERFTPEDTEARNIETSRLEVATFKSGVYSRYFAYLSKDRRITTWMGDTLATVTWMGAEYRCPGFGGFPSVRQNFTARGIDGRAWYGTFYKSSGDYVRMRVKKEREA